MDDLLSGWYSKLLSSWERFLKWPKSNIVNYAFKSIWKQELVVACFKLAWYQKEDWKVWTVCSRETSETESRKYNQCQVSKERPGHCRSEQLTSPLGQVTFQPLNPDREEPVSPHEWRKLFLWKEVRDLLYWTYTHDIECNSAIAWLSFRVPSDRKQQVWQGNMICISNFGGESYCGAKQDLRTWIGPAQNHIPVLDLRSVDTSVPSMREFYSVQIPWRVSHSSADGRYSNPSGQVTYRCPTSRSQVRYPVLHTQREG